MVIRLKLYPVAIDRISFGQVVEHGSGVVSSEFHFKMQQRGCGERARAMW